MIKIRIFTSILVLLILLTYIVDSSVLSGNLSPNNLLQRAKLIRADGLKGPESIVFDDEGFLYTGVSSGKILRLDRRNRVNRVYYIGDETNPDICSGALPKKVCGRPLGLRIVRNQLYVADAFNGIYKINTRTGAKRLLVSSNDSRFGNNPLKFVNDLDVDGNIIYFVDSTNQTDLNGLVQEIFSPQPKPTGRLYRYDQSTNELTLLIQNLYLPHSLTLTPNKDSLLINELTAYRISRYFLNRNSSSVEVFTYLPGLSNKIRFSNRQTILVPFVIVQNTIYGQYGLVAEYGLNGSAIRSWHDPSGKLVPFGATQMTLYNNKLYLGSSVPSVDFIPVIDYN